MYVKNTLRWLDLLPFVTQTYNERRKVNLGNLSPKLAKLPKNTEYVRDLLSQKKKNYESRFYNQKIKFKVNDSVKILKPKIAFSRGYTENYGTKVYKIEKILNTFPVTYLLHGLKSTFYSDQLIKVPEGSKNTFYIAQTKKVPDSYLRNGKISSYKTLTLIKDRNQPSYSEWKTDNEIEKMKKDNLLSTTFPTIIRPE